MTNGVMTSLVMVVLAGGGSQPVDPITVYLTRSQPQPLPSGEQLKALAKERRARWSATADANAEPEKALRKKHGGDFKKWPVEAQEAFWDLHEASVQAQQLWRETQGRQSDDSGRALAEGWLRKDLSKKKTLRLVDTPAEADLVIELVQGDLLKLSPGPRLQPLPTDRVDQDVLRYHRMVPELELLHRFKPNEGFWDVSCCANSATQAGVIELFVKANGDVLRAARQSQ